jgi:hypothetical protein
MFMSLFHGSILAPVPSLVALEVLAYSSTTIGAMDRAVGAFPSSLRTFAAEDS